MFNPILFSAYHKDDLMNKFLSRKEAIKEIEQIQIPLSTRNKINITLIFIQTFFYNTLISGIYPLLFEYMGETQNQDYIPYSLLIIASTYVFSYFSIMFYHYFGTKNIKLAYTISYFLFCLGSLAYIASYKEKYEKKENVKTMETISIVGFMVFSRIVIGLGANPTMGKKYILNYASKYFLPFISKIYVFISILGHTMGPLIGFLLYGIEDIKFYKYIYYSKYNCIGWYGFIMSILLLITHLILFTSPYSPKFNSLKVSNKSARSGSMISKDSPFLDNDLEDTQDKEFYKLQKEMKVKLVVDNDSELSEKKQLSFKDYDEGKIKNLSNLDDNINLEEDIKSDGGRKKAINIEEMILKSNTLEENQFKDIKTNLDSSNNYEINPLLISTNVGNIRDETQEEGSFVHINMIPRTIDDLIRREKKTFGYLNKNLLIILIILFFDNLLKENFVGYCSYSLYYSINFGENKKSIEIRYLSCLISLSYSSEIFSMPFILPLHKINPLIKKLLISLMIVNIILMIPLSFDYFVGNHIIIYFAIISCVFLISSIIEVISSCYLAYLTPPEWKFSHINAGALPLYVMTFGKLCGCLICLTAFSKNLLLNHHLIIVLTLFGYGISGIFILKSKNFRIKAIARIMRKSELEQNFI